MKRLGSFIVIALLAASIAGCSNEYQSERYLYRATKLARHIIMAPESVPPQEFNKALNSYELVFTRYPDSASAKRARMGIGSLYLAKKENIKAREVFNKALELYPNDKVICIEARFAIAKNYESQDLWDKALAEYKGIITDYPDTEIGLSLPVYIARYFEKEKDAIGANNAYRDAIAHYKSLAEKNPNTILGFRAQDYIVICYTRQENWQEAVNSLEKIVTDYPMARTVSASMRLVSDISINRLKDPGKAIVIFQKFLSMHPGHPANKYIQKGIEVLNNVSIDKQ